MKDLYLKFNPGMSIVHPNLKLIRNQILLFSLNLGQTEQPFSIPLIAGMAARVFSVSVVSPLELIRTKMQSQKLSYYGNYLVFNL